ncbi:F-box only protein 5 [Perognathus longimembris pacificus]|uniref:F-box only protein 5 n=1 Tax=Perognathus longimembris pacificus TaxID=214514 RepID=UPI002018EF39|nr:F-box only protein 5 [Perognathus longimembris pacificus]
MSRRPCSCIARSPSCSCSCCSCSCGSSPVTAAGRLRPSGSYKEESSTLSVKMKCGFNCSPVHSEFKLAKPDDSGRQDSYTSPGLEGSCKDSTKDYERLSYIGSPVVSPIVVELEPKSRPLHNKENQHVQPTLNSLSDLEEVEASRLYEDSGYSSFTQQSLSEHEEGSLALEESFRHSPQSCLLPTESSDSYPDRNLLPVLHFEKVVCSTLKKNAKRNPKIDREMIKEVIFRENFKLQNVIGRKMGLECVDILSELFRRDLRHLLASILTQLNGMDLISLSKVSTTWKKILENDKWAFQSYKKAVKRFFENKIKFSPHASTREYVTIRTALASVQKSTTQVPSRNTQAKVSSHGDQKGSTHSRHSEFSEMAKTLKKNESLKACVRCNSPAKYDCYLQRATCKREGCGFDYCTRCLCDYHTTKDCPNGRLLKDSCKTGPLPGTKKSKKNLRRL